MSQRAKEVVVLSGKGGTGKTTVLASLAALAPRKVVADCDVDAANLHLLLNPDINSTEVFTGGKLVVRDEALCKQHGKCQEVCRFDAITISDISVTACEGCGFCVQVCPERALRLIAAEVGTLYTGETKYGPFVSARLNPAAENSGRLVSLVREHSANLAAERDLPLVLFDGPPGIGCSATSAIVDTDFALLVTEPTLSGLHDLERVLELIRYFDVPAGIVINKADLNLQVADQIDTLRRELGLPLMGRIPYDEIVFDAVSAGVPLAEYTDGPLRTELENLWGKLEEQLEL